MHVRVTQSFTSFIRRFRKDVETDIEDGPDLIPHTVEALIERGWVEEIDEPAANAEPAQDVFISSAEGSSAGRGA